MKKLYFRRDLIAAEVEDSLTPFRGLVQALGP